MEKKEDARGKDLEQEISDDNEIFHDDRPFSKIALILDEIIDELKLAKISLHEFIESLGNNRDTTLSDIMFKYCGKYKNLFILADDVQNLV